MPYRKLSYTSVVACLAGTLVLLLTGNAAAQRIVKPASATKPAETRPKVERGIDLMRARWFGSADLPPTASPDEIEAKATPTSPTVMIKAPAAGGSATLFAIVDLPKVTSAGEVVIGDIDGRDDTFFNGKPIGSHVSVGVTDTGTPRVYFVDKGLLKQGRNVLAIQLRAVHGSERFGIRKQPLTFGFVKTPAHHNGASNAQPAKGVTAVPEDEARAAIADAVTSSPEPIYRKRASFGRFGKLFHDGLPAVVEVSPTRTSNRYAPVFDIALDHVEDVSIASSPPEPGIDGWHKLSRVAAKANNTPVAYTMLQHVLYPGAIATLEQGNALQVRIRFPRGHGSVQPWSDADVLAVFEGEAPTGFSAFSVYEASDKSVPAILAFVGGASNLTQSEEHVDISFSRSKTAGAEAKMFVFFPTGLDPVDLSAAPRGALDLAQVVTGGVNPAHELRQWLRVGLNEPVAADEYFQVLPAQKQVRVFQVCRYRNHGGSIARRPVRWVPPQIIHARDTLKYPVELPQTTETRILAFSGRLHEVVVNDDAQTTDSLVVVSYSLPVPPLDERGLLVPAGRESLLPLLNQHLSDLATTTAVNGVDALYKTRTQGFQAFSFLDEKNRKRLLDNSRTIVPGSLADSGWYRSAERFSGLEFWWTYFIEGPYFDRFDQDWGNGLALIGLYTFVKYTGNWDFAEQVWPAIEGMFSWFSATDDWEWMRASNGIHGHGTGAGDCMSATYSAAIAYARLAEGLGKNDEHAHGTYYAARAAMMALNRFAYNDFGDRNGFKPENSSVLGFHEGEGFLVGELSGYPWNVTSNISGNGVQPHNFDLYLQYASDSLRDYENTFDGAFPHWSIGNHNYGMPTLYHGNSGYITLPHIYLRARVGIDKYDMLVQRLEQANSNQRMWWLAPPVIAEVMNAGMSAYVSDWGKCGFLGGRATPDPSDQKKVHLEVRFDNRHAPDTVELAIPRRPLELQVNNGPVPLTDSQFENERLRVKLRRPGVNTLTVTY